MKETWRGKDMKLLHTGKEKEIIKLVEIGGNEEKTHRISCRMIRIKYVTLGPSGTKRKDAALCGVTFRGACHGRDRMRWGQKMQGILSRKARL